MLRPLVRRLVGELANTHKPSSLLSITTSTDNKIHAQLITQANEAGVNSLEAPVADVVSGGKVTG